MEIREQFGAIVRKIRNERRMTQEEVAFRANMNVTYLSDLERGLWNPSLAMIVDLARALGTHPSELLEDLVVDPHADLPKRRRPED